MLPLKENAFACKSTEHQIDGTDLGEHVETAFIEGAMRHTGTGGNLPGGDDGVEDGDQREVGEPSRARSMHSPGVPGELRHRRAGWRWVRGKRSQVLVDQKALVLLMLMRNRACIRTEEWHNMLCERTTLVQRWRTHRWPLPSPRQLTRRVRTTGTNQAQADFRCLWPSAASSRLKNSFLTCIHSYYLNPSTHSPMQLFASSLAGILFKKFSLT